VNEREILSFTVVVKRQEVKMKEPVMPDLYKFLLLQLSEGIIISDTDGQILFVNPAAEKIRNLKKESILGNNILQCHQEASREKVARAIEFLKTHEDKTFHRMVTDLENKKTYENTYSAIFDDKSELAGMAVITRDVTMQRKAEEARANAGKQFDPEWVEVFLEFAETGSIG